MPFLVPATSALSPVPLEHRSWAQLCTDMAWLVPWSHLTDRTVEAQGCKCIIAGLPIASILWQSLLSGHSNILHVVWSCWCLGPCPGCLSWVPVLAACPGCLSWVPRHSYFPLSAGLFSGVVPQDTFCDLPPYPPILPGFPGRTQFSSFRHRAQSITVFMFSDIKEELGGDQVTLSGSRKPPQWLVLVA